MTPWGQQWRSHMGHSHGDDEHDDGNENDQLVSPEEARAADRITWAGVYVNILLSGLKGVAGFAFNSSSLVADGVHSMSDLLSDGVTLLALKYCAKPPDEKQPYGYGKYETMGALTVAMLLVGGSVGIIHHSGSILYGLWEPSMIATVDPAQLQALNPTVRETVEAIVQEHARHGHSHSLEMHPAALGIAMFSVGAKEALYRAAMVIGKRVNSSVLIANAWHHRSDAITSLVAMTGIGLSVAGFPMFDPLAGMLVGGIILKMGGSIGWQAVRELCDGQLAPKTLERIALSVNNVVSSNTPEIVGVRHLRGRKLGRQLHVDLTIVLDDTNGVSFARACELKRLVRNAIQAEIPRVTDVVIELAQPAHEASTIFEATKRFGSSATAPQQL